MSDEPQDDLPPAVRWLLARLQRLIGEATQALAGQFDAATRAGALAAWRDQVAQQLTRYALAAYMAGSGGELGPAGQAQVKQAVEFQIRFLDRFRLEMQSAAAWQRGWEARAASYANSVKAPYWRGQTRMLPLPAMPAEGTQCRGNCGCSWEIVVVDEARGDYDCYWKRGKGDSCQTCVVRSAEWGPLRIRGGEIQ